jgi:indolepyruvate/phenylpyruvate decarboxylase
MPTLANALLEGLRDHGAREIFGIPGDFVLPFFKTIEESNILPCFTLSHEPAVGFAADAAARYHGGIGVAVVTYGAGAFNLVNSIAGAYAERSPVVVIAGAPGARERAGGYLLHHQVRTVDTQLAVFREFTCDQAVLTDPATAPGDIARVLRNALEMSLPVYIEFPRDMVDARVEQVPLLPRRAADPDALAECADEVLARIANAAAPVLMVDVEIRRYGIEAQVAALARKLGLPVVTTFMGRGLLEAAGDVFAGTYLGAAGDPAVTRLVEDADLLLLFGVILSDTNFALSNRVTDSRRTIFAAGRSDRRPRCPRHAAGAAARQGSGGDRLPARAARRRSADRAVGYRRRHQRFVRPPRQDADDIGYRRLPVHGHGDRQHRAGGTGLLCRNGFRGAGRLRRRRDRASPAGAGRRRRVPDDGVGARQLPPLRSRSHRRAFQQLQLGNAARVPAGIALQRSR